MVFRDLYYFAEAAKDLHFTKTAERLFVSQQNLSSHIKRLEDHYHVVLFERKPKLALTYAGRRMLEYAEEMLAKEGDLNEEMKGIQGETAGELVIGASTPRLRVLLPEILPQFLKEYPKIRIRTSDAYAVELKKQVLENKVDIAFAPVDPDDPEFHIEMMHRDNIFVVCADRLLYRVYGPEAFEIKASCVKGCTMDRIAKLPFIVPSSRNQLSTEFYSCFEEQNLTPNILLETAFPLYFFPLFSDGTASLAESLEKYGIRDLGAGHTPIYRDMLGALRENREPVCSGTEGRKALELILAIYESAASGKPVRLPLTRGATTDHIGRFDK